MMVQTVKDQKQIIEASIRRYLERAQKSFGCEFDFPTVDLDLQGSVAGRTWYHKKHLQFNSELYSQNKRKFLKTTIPHEVSHLVAFKISPDKGKCHGKVWRSVMRELGAIPKRHHDYDVSKLKKVENEDYYDRETDFNPFKG